jgi:hypothetical protein
MRARNCYSPAGLEIAGASDMTETTSIPLTGRGKIASLGVGGIVVFAPSNTKYELHLLVTGGRYEGPVGKPIEGIIRVKARKLWSVPSGGNFVSPLFGEPRTIQGRVRQMSDGMLVVHAGTNFHIELPTGSSGIELTSGPISIGTMVNVMAMPDATFELSPTGR